MRYKAYRKKKEVVRNASSMVGAPAPKLPLISKDVRQLEKQKKKEAKQKAKEANEMLHETSIYAISKRKYDEI